MAPQSSPGTCLLCRAPVTKRGALKHCLKCLAASGWPSGERSSLIIRIEGKDERKYWMLALARHDAHLKDLDQLIRDVWVECCGHLSAFEIGGVSYDSCGDEYPSETMDVPLSNVIRPGSTFTYDYDFGSTTSLDLKVIGATPVAPRGLICLIARNNRPTISCDLCGGDAEFVLNEFDWGMPRYCCRTCLSSADPDPCCVNLIANSPRNGVCDYVEDPVTALLWYPSGWSADEIVPEELEETLDLLVPLDDSPADLVVGDLQPEIDAFFEAERAAYGDKAGSMAGETVTIFCTFMHTLHGENIGAWSARSVQRCLIEHLAQNPIFLENWPENAVPILCRFLMHLEASGRLTNASELIAALEYTEPAFQETVNKPAKFLDLFWRIRTKAEKSGINPDDMDTFFTFAMDEVIRLSGVDSNDEAIRKKLASTFGDRTTEEFQDVLIAVSILLRCEDFCSRFEDAAVFEGCRRILGELFDHPAAPLSRGNGVLWSAAVVYAACRDAGLIRPGRGGSSLAQEIASFFGLEISSIRRQGNGAERVPRATAARLTGQQKVSTRNTEYRLMIVIGIDPGIARTGYGVLSTEGRFPTPLTFGCIETSGDCNTADRLLQVYEAVSCLLDEYSPAWLAMEKLFFSRNVTSAMHVSEARGVILLAAEQHGVQIAEYTPNQIKQAVTGSGRADKHQMQEMMRRLLGLDDIPRPDDTADGLAIALCHINTVVR